MSNYFSQAVNPDTGKVEQAEWLDDYFGRHQYGVRFLSTGKIFRESEIKQPRPTLPGSDVATFEWIKQRWGGFGYLVLGRNENFQLNFCNEQLILHAESDDRDSPVWEIMLFDKPTQSQVAQAERMFGVELS